MKKFLLLILCSINLLTLSCSNSRDIKNKNISYVEARFNSSTPNFIFFENDFSLTADITTSDFVAYESGETNKPRRTESAELHVYKVVEYQHGSIFKLIIPHIDNQQGYLHEGRLNIYFYVTTDKIYRLWSYVFQDDLLVEFYNDDDLLVKQLDTDEKILSNSYLIYQLDSSQDKLKKDDIGFHNKIEISDNQVISRAWITKHNGDTDFYEIFVWDLSDGFFKYISGFGAKSDILEITNFKKIDK